MIRWWRGGAVVNVFPISLAGVRWQAVAANVSGPDLKNTPRNPFETFRAPSSQKERALRVELTGWLMQISPLAAGERKRDSGSGLTTSELRAN